VLASIRAKHCEGPTLPFLSPLFITLSGGASSEILYLSSQNLKRPHAYDNACSRIVKTRSYVLYAQQFLVAL